LKSSLISRTSQGQWSSVIMALHSDHCYFTITKVMRFNITSPDTAWSLMPCMASDCNEPSRDNVRNGMRFSLWQVPWPLIGARNVHHRQDIRF
jgi:hypothetical protein